MQRYRINYRLLIGLVVGAFVAAPASYGLWRFQVDRNATRLLAKADDADASGDPITRYDSLSQYVKLRPDEMDARRRLGIAAADLADVPDLDVKRRSESYFVLIDAVRVTGDQELRRRLVDLHLRYGFADRALLSINELIEAGQGDAKLKGMRAQCLFATQNATEGIKWSYRLMGYDPKTNEFDQTQAEAPEEPLVYFLAAQYLYANREDELANRVIDQMVEANPESREAFVYQYQILKAQNRPEDARAALTRAYELDPKDAGVLISKGIEAIADYQAELTDAVGDEAEEQRREARRHLDAAAALFAEGIELYPDRSPFYEYAVRVEMVRENYDHALELVDQALKKFDLRKALNVAGLPVAIDLALQKIDILFAQQKLDAVETEIKALRDLGNAKVAPLADYYQARLEMVRQNWLAAAKMFNDVKHRLITSTTMQAMASASQGLCHSQLGQWDLAREAYRWALSKVPGMPMALAGLDEVASKIGGQGDEGDSPMQFDQLVQQMSLLPRDQQNWDQIEAQIDEFVQSQAQVRSASESWIESRRQLLRAQVYVARASATDDADEKARMFKAARDAIVAAHREQPDDPTVQIAAPRVLAMEPGSGPAQALKLLDNIIAKNEKRGVKETVAFRLLRIDLLMAQQDEQVVNQLLAATEGMDDWPAQAQASIWSAVGTRLEQLNQFQDAALCLEKAIKLDPARLPYRVALFELARKQADDAAMQEAQEKILELVKSKSDPDYVLAEVKRMMVSFATGNLTKDDLKRARTLLDQAIQQRNTWAELYVLSAQLSLMLEQSSSQALAELDQALKYSSNNLNALNLQVRLLAELGRFAEARKRMDMIPRHMWSPLLDRTAANVLRAVGENAEALAEARKLADAGAKDPATQVWFAEVAAAAGEDAAAEAALKLAVDLRPYDPDMWTSLLNFYMLERRGDEVEATLRQAQLQLDEEYLTLLTAQQHRLFGRFSQAESILQSAYESRMDDVGVAQRMAEFYLTWAENADLQRQEAQRANAPADQWPPSGEAQRGEAAAYLNRVLRSAYKGETPLSNPAVAWARRQAARLLSLSGDYQDSLKAERLLSAALENNAATAEGEDLLVEVLNRRGDPASRERIVGLLRKIQRERGLDPVRELLLGKALFDVGDWDGAQRHMQQAITRHPQDAALRVGLVEMLIDRREFTEADRWMSRLSALPGSAAALPQLRVRLAAAKGDKAEVRKQLAGMTPDLRALNPQQLQIVRAVALLADSVDDHEYALNLIVEYSRRVPGNDMELARYTALYGNLDTGIEMLSRLFPSAMDQVLSTAIEVLRERRGEDQVKLDEFVNRLVRQARRDDPEAARRMVLEAEALEVQERFDDAVAAYEAILRRDDVPQFIRASAINNLAFLQAMLNRDLDRALEGVNEAIEIIGPISDILDTRALVQIRRGDYDAAVADLKLAVKMGGTASKYFHLAEALLGAGDEDGAIAAWEQAEIRGLSRDSTPEVERADYESTLNKIEALRLKRGL